MRKIIALRLSYEFSAEATNIKVRSSSRISGEGGENYLKRSERNLASRSKRNRVREREREVSEEQKEDFLLLLKEHIFISN